MVPKPANKVPKSMVHNFRAGLIVRVSSGTPPLCERSTKHREGNDDERDNHKNQPAREGPNLTNHNAQLERGPKHRPTHSRANQYRNANL